MVRDASLPRRSRNSLALSKTRPSGTRLRCRRIHLHAQPIRACVHGPNFSHPHPMVRTPVADRIDDQRTQGTHVARSCAVCAHRDRHGGNKCEFGDLCFARPTSPCPLCGLDHERDLAQGSIQGTPSYRCRDRASAVVVALWDLHPREVRTPHSPTHRDRRDRCSDVNGTGSTSRPWLLVLLRKRRTRRLDRVWCALYDLARHAGSDVCASTFWTSRCCPDALEIPRLFRVIGRRRPCLRHRHVSLSRPFSNRCTY